MGMQGRQEQEQGQEQEGAGGEGFDPVLRPSHYGGDDGADPLAIMEQMGIAEAFAAGSAIKYLFRAGKKQGQSEDQDREKALFYSAYMLGGRSLARRAVEAARAERPLHGQDLLHAAVAGPVDGRADLSDPTDVADLLGPDVSESVGTGRGDDQPPLVLMPEGVAMVISCRMAQGQEGRP